MPPIQTDPLREGAALLGLGRFLARPAAGHAREGVACAVVCRCPGGPEDGPLQGGGQDHLAPGGDPVLGLRRLLVVDQAPHLVEHLLAHEAGKQAAEDAEGDEQELHGAEDYLRTGLSSGRPGWRNWRYAAGLSPAARKGMWVRVPPRALPSGPRSATSPVLRCLG